jgi:hypothetical protein
MVLSPEQLAETGEVDFHFQFFGKARQAIRVGSFGGFPDLSLRLEPILNRSTYLAYQSSQPSRLLE